MTLQEKLFSEGRTRWLDVGCGGNFERNYYYLDLFPEDIINPEFKDRYFRIDILNLTEEQVDQLGVFDLVRMQHTFEHFSYEEGRKVLENCALLLKSGGIILITVPDLRIHIDRYLTDTYKEWKGFRWWANKRVPQDSPNSFYFSVFAHSMPWESHKWCYDFEGLAYQLKHSEKFDNIRELKLDDPEASIPFTHNRPEEDVCVMALKK
jgi:predicted SAM-dependent methyltransferase